MKFRTKIKIKFVTEGARCLYQANSFVKYKWIDWVNGAKRKTRIKWNK